MRRPKPHLFLARAPYRRRRLRDAARLLPVVGIILLLMPLLWTEDAERRLTSNEVIYFFLVWIGLILVAAAFAAGLRSGDAAGEEEED